MPEINNRFFWITIDILNIIGRAERLKLLMALKPGRKIAKDLTREVYGDNSTNHCTQSSAALAPMRRANLVNSIREGRIIYYELTSLGRKVLTLVESINEHAKQHGTVTHTTSQCGQ